MRSHCPTSVLFSAGAMLCGMALSFPASAQEATALKAAGGHSIKLAEPIDAAKTLEQRLEARATFQGEEATLRNFAEALETALDVSVVLATKKLEESAIDVDTPLTYKLRNVRVRTALEFILGDIGLSCVIKENVLIISTHESVCEQLVTRVYDCRGLMKLPSPIKKIIYSPRPFVVTSGTPRQTKTGVADAGPDGGYDIDDLILVLTMVVEPNSWDDVGGPGAVSEFKGLFAIHQTPSTHEKVENLLNMLHEAGGLKEKVKVSR